MIHVFPLSSPHVFSISSALSNKAQEPPKITQKRDFQLDYPCNFIQSPRALSLRGTYVKVISLTTQNRVRNDQEEACRDNKRGCKIGG